MVNPLYDTLFGRHAGKATPFLHLEDGQTITHSDFLARTARFANALAAMGLKPGDRLAAQIDKSADALVLYAACVQSGLVFLPLNTAYTADEVSYFIENSGAALFVCQPERRDALTGLATATNTRLETLGTTGGGSLADLAKDQPDVFETVERTIDDLAAFLYTSGTTGRSKGAMLTQGNLLSNATTLVDIWAFTEQDVLLHALPIFHTHGLFVAVNVTLMAGGSMIFMSKFDLDFMVTNMHRATTMMGVPTFYTRLLDDPRFTKDIAQHMRLFISGSAPLLAETHVAFENRTGLRILERYGMTETNMNTSNPYGGDRRAGTVGFPLPGVELKITDPATGKTLPTGEIGQIEVRGQNVFAGYWQMPEKTAEELRADGFFITGDLGMIDDDGYVTIVGRNKDLIISGGFNIYPKEIELVLDEQPGVLESAVIGVPHPDFGETVIGLIVAKAGETPNLDQISETIAQSLARFKQPRKLVIISELPRNTMGKVQKNVLRQSYEAAFES
ncbi:malonyl-CoA/methylmalonyl-CoA synthetase [Yoonia maritima]|uniref:Malonyl-CoA/methylmalonyl-CoA synthetase n=1 Tax=Yoonia maritima TaxID=1435347 RepID=A0A2T0W575_9RHOB|nr:malonyl-CoA synthase [Yoonia maritima]PRY80628.1 malonyl-CoA/methylmalonyl-CoA synthetase [Yoonia maritima]